MAVHGYKSVDILEEKKLESYLSFSFFAPDYFL